MPFYQAAIQKLPYGKTIAAAVMGILLRQKVRAVVNGASMTLNLRESIQRTMFLGGYEPTQTAWFRECVVPGDTVIDVGASFGYYTTLAASLVGHGRAFAFEPSPIASEVLERAIRDSHLTNVLLTKAAVGKTNGEVELFMPTTRHLHSPSIIPNDPEFAPLRVPLIALDAFPPLQGSWPIKLMKVDVEGYEPDVLDGMETMLRAKRVLNVFCEFNSWWLEHNSTTPALLLQRFLDHGYRIKKETALQEHLPAHKGGFFSLQDRWFTLSQT